ncbi:hypothetical protein HDU91_006737 [Kappamyces sp. JEL0680]|nr:hypothetical protein HDU91_006737 [Kappamyces sp. JEL0680]
MIRSLHRHIRTPFEIVIINDNSQFPVTVNMLHRLQESGIKVMNTDIQWEDFNELVARTSALVQSHMENSSSDTYIVTDPDCALDSAPGNILLIYQKVLEALNLHCVGGSIRWDDWPEDLPAYEDAMVTKEAQSVNINRRNYYYIRADVDTTFAMYNRTSTFKRLEPNRSVRMLPPLGIRHLDFYLSKQNVPPDVRHYLDKARASGTSHQVHL